MHGLKESMFLRPLYPTFMSSPFQFVCVIPNGRSFRDYLLPRFMFQKIL